MASPEVIDVDADEPPRIVGGTGKPDAPLEIASSDSEDENPAKRAKPAPVTPPYALRAPGAKFSETDRGDWRVDDGLAGAPESRPAAVRARPHSRRQGPARDPGHGERDERHCV